MYIKNRVLFLSIMCTNFYIITNSLKYRWLSIHCSEVSNKIVQLAPDSTYYNKDPHVAGSFISVHAWQIQECNNLIGHTVTSSIIECHQTIWPGKDHLTLLALQLIIIIRLSGECNYMWVEML